MVISQLAQPLISRARPLGTAITTIVIHSSGGSSLSGAIETLRQRELSYHYVIDRTGRVWKCVAITRIAFHAGSSYGPREMALGVSLARDRRGRFVAKCSVNPYSIGICLINNDAKERPTPAQRAALVRLVKELKQKTFYTGPGGKLVPSIVNLTSHHQVSYPRKVDPYQFDGPGVASEVGLAWFARPDVPVKSY